MVSMSDLLVSDLDLSINRHLCMPGPNARPFCLEIEAALASFLPEISGINAPLGPFTPENDIMDCANGRAMDIVPHPYASSVFTYPIGCLILRIRIQ